MCREALKGYLEGQETGAGAEAVARFVDGYDPSGLPLDAARRISQSLADVKVVDPACGSGAYLLGMMQELIELQTALYNVGVDAKALYGLKLETIQAQPLRGGHRRVRSEHRHAADVAFPGHRLRRGEA